MHATYRWLIPYRLEDIGHRDHVEPLFGLVGLQVHRVGLEPHGSHPRDALLATVETDDVVAELLGGDEK